jgi:hypothetical protein
LDGNLHRSADESNM